MLRHFHYGYTIVQLNYYSCKLLINTKMTFNLIHLKN